MAIEGTIDNFPERTYSRQQLLDRARVLQWYHTVQAGDTTIAPGLYALDPFVPYYLMPDSLKGLSCLEVGAGNGYWSFKMEERDAASVVATDIEDYFYTDFSRYHGQPPPCTAPAAYDGEFAEPFRLAALLRGSKVRYQVCSVYDLRPERTGEHDVVFCGSMLMHLFGPEVALQRMAGICRDAFLITTETDLSLDGEPLLRYHGHKVPFVHFIPSPSCLADMVRACGYETVLRGPTFFLTYRDPEKNRERHAHTAILALKNDAATRFPVAPAREYGPAERKVEIEGESVPARVTAGGVADLLIRYRNPTATAWRSGPGPLRLAAGYEIESDASGWKKLVSGTRTVTDVPFCDYLPAGLATLVRMKIPVPAGVSRLRVRPFLAQGGRRFESNPLELEIKVS